jgi:hypothetical protein
MVQKAIIRILHKNGILMVSFSVTFVELQGLNLVRISLLPKRCKGHKKKLKKFCAIYKLELMIKRFTLI